MKKRFDAIGSGRGEKPSRLISTPQTNSRASKDLKSSTKSNSKLSTPKTDKSQGQFTFANPSKRSTRRDSLDGPENISYDNFYEDEPLEREHLNPYRRSDFSDHKGSGLDRESLEQSIDMKIVAKDLQMTKKSLHESQAKCISMTKELSKVQHENTILQMQTKRLDLKCKDLIDKATEDETKIKELTYLNNQITNDMSRVKTDSQESNMKTRDNIDKLKRSLIDVEKVMEKKNNRVLVNIQKQRALLSSIQRAVETTNSTLFGRLAQSFDKLVGMMNSMVEVLHSRTLEELDQAGGEEADIIVNLNDTIIRLEADNAECKNEAIILDNKLKVEQRKSKEVIGQYRDSVNKLRRNTNLMREKIRELQEVRQSEKQDSSEQIQNLDRKAKRISEENLRLKSLNIELNKQVGEYEESIKRNEHKLQRLLDENKQVHQKLQTFEEYFNARDKVVRKPIHKSASQNNVSPHRNVHTSPSQMRNNHGDSFKRHVADDRDELSPILAGLPRKVKSPYADKYSSNKKRLDFESKPVRHYDEHNDNRPFTMSPNKMQAAYASDGLRANTQDALNFSYDLTSSQSNFRRTDNYFNKKFSSHGKTHHNKHDFPLSRSHLERRSQAKEVEDDYGNSPQFDDEPEDEEVKDDKFMEYLTGNPANPRQRSFYAEDTDLDEGFNDSRAVDNRRGAPRRRTDDSVGNGENPHYAHQRNLSDNAEEEEQGSMTENLLKDEIIDLDNEIAEIQRSLANEIIRNKM